MATKRKAKKSGKLASIADMPEISQEQIESAKKLILGQAADVPYHIAKRFLTETLEMSKAEANATVVKLYEEGFLSGEKNIFRLPDVKVQYGIVRGARFRDDFTVVCQDDPETEIPLNPDWVVLPGDVMEIRPSVGRHALRVAGLMPRVQKRWVCKLVEDAWDSWKGVIVQPVNAFAPVRMVMEPSDSIPPLDELQKCAFEVELVEEEGTPKVRGDLKCRFVKTVGNRFDPLGEIAIAAAEYDLPVEFSPEALAEADALPDEVDGWGMRDRVDLRDIPFVTIDGEDARDFDDAVYCTREAEGEWRLLVAIADVAHYVRPKSPLDMDAQRRGTSVYFPSSVVPMLPEKLSNGLCSLNPHVDRLTLVCDAVINAAGETTAYQFYPAVICSHARLTYTNVWNALQGGETGRKALGALLEPVETLYSLFKVLREARKARHTLDFETVETQALFDENGHITGFKERDHNDAHRLIEECMLVANTCAADFVTLKKREALFRVHDKPEEDRVRTLNTMLANYGLKLTGATPVALAELVEKTRDNPVLQTAILRTMSRACYTPDNIGHFGLQYDKYAHFTSPIRRYPDLLLHRVIKAILADKSFIPKIVIDDAQLLAGRHARALGSRPEEEKKPARGGVRHAVWTRLGILCSAAERRADDASRDVMNYLKCQYMLDQPRRQYDAVVTGMIPAGIFVSLNDIAIEGFVHISRLGWGYWEFDEKRLVMESAEEMEQYRIGDALKVTLEEVDLENRRLSFIVVSHGRRSRRRRRY